MFEFFLLYIDNFATFNSEYDNAVDSLKLINLL
jgi:hypothetical protein